MLVIFSCEYGKISDIEVKNGNVFGYMNVSLIWNRKLKPNAAIWINDKRYQIIDNSSNVDGSLNSHLKF